MKDCSHKLSITTYLINTLVKLRFNLSRETFKLIMNSISPMIINEENEIGWEEITNANIVYLLKMVLNKDIKDS